MTPHLVRLMARSPSILGILTQGQPLVALDTLTALPLRVKLLTAGPNKLSSPSLRKAPNRLPVAKIRMILPAIRDGNVMVLPH